MDKQESAKCSCVFLGPERCYLGVLSFIVPHEPMSIFVSPPSFRNYQDRYRPVTRWWYRFHPFWLRPPHLWISFHPTPLRSHSCDNWGLAQKQKIEHAGIQGSGPGLYVGRAGSTLVSKTKDTLRSCLWLQILTLPILWHIPPPQSLLPTELSWCLGLPVG